MSQKKVGAYTWRKSGETPETWYIEPKWRQALGVIVGIRNYGPLVEGRGFSGWRILGGHGQFETRDEAMEAARVQLNRRALALSAELRERADVIQELLTR